MLLSISLWQFLVLVPPSHHPQSWGLCHPARKGQGEQAAGIHGDKVWVLVKEGVITALRTCYHVLIILTSTVSPAAALLESSLLTAPQHPPTKRAATVSAMGQLPRRGEWALDHVWRWYVEDVLEAAMGETDSHGFME